MRNQAVRKEPDKGRAEHHSRRGLGLFGYDFITMIIVEILYMLMWKDEAVRIGVVGILLQTALAVVCVAACRKPGGVYKQVWRYGRSSAYLRLIMTDAAAGLAYSLLQKVMGEYAIPVSHAASMIAIDMLIALVMRHLYQYMYENAGKHTKLGSILRRIVKVVAGIEIRTDSAASMGERGKSRKTRIAIIGAGSIGTMLVEELLRNEQTTYEPCCFVDNDNSKVGREILGLHVYSENEFIGDVLDRLGIQEIVFALPDVYADRKEQLYERYRSTGCKLKVYDFPIKSAERPTTRRLREFDIEELLFRKPLQFTDDKTAAFYKGKCVLITGGGGSIGSELCRQIVKMSPKRVVVFDINENDTYNLQQQMLIQYGDQLDFHVEIGSVCDRCAVEQIFERYHPAVVLHAAAHKHVPLMDNNCCEAVQNNVFGTLTVVEAAEKYHVEKFIMISTDKAVNPTNVMGATKRMCEMIVQSRCSQTSYSATRFGNVLGSNGSVIPLFKQQIMHGGPVTLTDRRIIRYFMTIPEASQLVLQSGAMAENGELYVLDMGKPVKILDLAENMIRLSGYVPYKDIDIIETGLRPGEKLYEELLIKTEELDKTENKLIFIEREQRFDSKAIEGKLNKLREALQARDDDLMRQTLMQVVPTYHDSREVNAKAIEADEMKQAGIAG